MNKNFKNNLNQLKKSLQNTVQFTGISVNYKITFGDDI